MKGRSRSPWNILSSGNSTGILSSGNNTGILSSGNNTGILSSGNNTGILSSGNNTGILSSGNNTGFSGLVRFGKGLLNRAKKALSFGGGWGLVGGLVSTLFGQPERGRGNQSDTDVRMGDSSEKATGWGNNESPSFLSSAKTAKREENLGERKGNRDATATRREEKAADHEAEVEVKEAKAVELAEALDSDDVSEAQLEKLTQDVESADTPTAEAEAATDGTGRSHEVQGPKPEVPQSSSNAGLLPEWDD